MIQPGSDGSRLTAATQGDVKWAAVQSIPPLRRDTIDLEVSAVSIGDAYCAGFQFANFAPQRWDRDERCPFHIAMRRRR